MDKSYWQSIVVYALHCGSGCTLDDIVAQIFLFFVRVVLFGSKLFGEWGIDYIFALATGVIFQYNSIKPMKYLSSKEAMLLRLKLIHYLLQHGKSACMDGWQFVLFLFFIAGWKLQLHSFG